MSTQTDGPTDRFPSGTEMMGLAGRWVAFTGRLASMSTRQAASLVLVAGGRHERAVTPRLHILVVGMHGWPLIATGHVTAKLAEAERLRHGGAPLRIVSERVFREIVGLDPEPEGEEKPLDAAHVAEVLNVTSTSLERWEHLGLVHPRRGRYDFADLLSLRTVTDLVARGVSPAVIRRSLEGLRRVLPGVDRPLAQLNILVSDRGGLVAELEHALVSPAGQFELRFDRPGPRACGSALLPLRPAGPARPADADGWMALGVARERRGDHAGAERAYRRAVRLDPSDAAAQLNLGNALLARGRPSAAAERFGQAVALDPRLACGWYNLAHAQEATGRPGAAMRSLRRALAIDPGFADAHFNLADLCHRQGLIGDAERAWGEYLRLDAAGEWADHAREGIGRCRGGSWA